MVESVFTPAPFVKRSVSIAIVAVLVIGCFSVFTISAGGTNNDNAITVLNYGKYIDASAIDVSLRSRNRMELIVRSLAEQNGVTEQLKAENQMEWVRQMNACKAQAEEIVKVELIYD